MRACMDILLNNSHLILLKLIERLGLSNFFEHAQVIDTSERPYAVYTAAAFEKERFTTAVMHPNWGDTWTVRKFAGELRLGIENSKHTNIRAIQQFLVP